MPRPIALPDAGKPKRFPLRLPDELADDLYAFCEASSAFHTKVICKAVRRLIDDELSANPGLREAFDRERARLAELRRRSGEAPVIRLVKSKGTRRRRRGRSNRKSR